MQNSSIVVSIDESCALPVDETVTNPASTPTFVSNLPKRFVPAAKRSTPKKQLNWTLNSATDALICGDVVLAKEAAAWAQKSGFDVVWEGGLPVEILPPF
ncbi:hypothetical protein [Kamptonema sp. UHCC 0994]|uniref:hypothetical protein n=1 Tax=Kamptonema sp. UHCC 0994 TaxID=3031329 RepID=UPI0023BA3945|nr:hypothetical protein [Kamptonema sp. UHCC 0994]MDF0554931.1 hypothetical protein [Kamptonema sp. UHCC 0994]